MPFLSVELLDREIVRRLVFNVRERLLIALRKPSICGNLLKQRMKLLTSKELLLHCSQLNLRDF